jgi:hypothetical protein
MQNIFGVPAKTQAEKSAKVVILKFFHKFQPFLRSQPSHAKIIYQILSNMAWLSHS